MAVPCNCIRNAVEFLLHQFISSPFFNERHNEIPPSLKLQNKNRNIYNNLNLATGVTINLGISNSESYRNFTPLVYRQYSQ